MSVYYNEFDQKAAQWLRELIRAKQIPDGYVDTRSIEDVTPLDLAGFTQCHFFAGIGGWPLALAIAGIPESTPLWTGSCPCQPFSTAGRQKGFDDSRHLWPAWRWLVGECHPDVILGEQVSSPAGRAWLSYVLTDVEALGYAGAAAALCAAGVGAPHIRERIYWVAQSRGERLERVRLHVQQRGSQPTGAEAGRGGEDRDGVEYASGTGGRWDSRTISREEAGTRLRALADLAQPAGADSGLADSNGAGSQGRGLRGDGAYQRATWAAGLDSPWSHVDWVRCNDPNGERWRPIEPGTQPLAHGVPERVGLLRGYGNAIVPQVAALFIQAALG